MSETSPKKYRCYACRSLNVEFCTFDDVFGDGFVSPYDDEYGFSLVRCGDCSRVEYAFDEMAMIF